MIATDDKRSEYPSDLADLRRVPLANVAALSEDVLDECPAEARCTACRAGSRSCVQLLYLTARGNAT